MTDELRERIAAFLSGNSVCVISTSGNQGAWSVVARYQHRGLLLDCRVPRWSDALFQLEQDPRLVVTILDAAPGSSRWLQVCGSAQIDSATVDGRHTLIHVTPMRVDLIDESQGWGARETLDF